MTACPCWTVHNIPSFPESVRLYNGTDRCSGRVEVFHEDRWGKLCSNYLSHDAAVAVCQELNCGAPKKSQENFNFGDTNLIGFTARCSGPISSISECTLQEYAGECEGASLSCAGKTQKVMLLYPLSRIAKDRQVVYLPSLSQFNESI